MNNTIKKAVKFVIGLLFVLSLAIFSDAGTKGAKTGLEMCLQSVVPSLFPFMVVTTYLMKSGAFSFSGQAIEKISNTLLCLPSKGLLIYIFSLIGGYPIGAKLIGDGIADGTITKNQGKRMLLFCVNSGPAFVINIVGIYMLGSKKAGVILLVGMSIASLMLGILSKIFAKDEPTIAENKDKTEKNAFVTSVNDSLKGILSICGWILIFTSFQGIINSLSISENAKMWINMLGEVTSGCSVSVKSYPVSVTAFVLGFAGVCIHLQIMKFISLTGLRYIHFFVSRILHGGLSFAIASILFKMFPCNVQVFSNMGEIVPKVVSVSVPATIALIFLFSIVILDLAEKAKV